MRAPKDHQKDQLTEMQKQGLLCAQYKPAGTSSQQQEKVPALLEGII